MGDTAVSYLKELSNVTADAKKRLGKKGKLPAPRKDPAVVLAKSAAMAKSIDSELKKLIKALQDYRTTLSDVEGDCDDYAALIAKSDFKLSKANIDEEKIINHVNYAMTKCLNGIGYGSKSPRQVASKILDVLKNGDDISAF